MTLVLLIVGMIFSVPSVGACGQSQTVAAREDDVAVAKALAIAAAKPVDGDARLRELRATVKTEAVVDYIDLMLDKWNAERHTYIAAHPLRVSQQCLDPRPDDAFTVRTVSRVAFTIAVDEHGTATEVKLPEGSKDPELAARMADYLKKQRYVPANKGSGPEKGTMLLVCAVELR